MTVVLSHAGRRATERRRLTLAGSAVLALVVATPLTAQSPSRGDNIAPVYEGFWRNDDGTIDLFFGYYNRNWGEIIDVPIGPDNQLQSTYGDMPAGPEMGQPTHFFPRRNQFVFKVRVPADFAENEVVWMLRTNGVTERAYGTLRAPYAVDAVVMAANFGAGGQTGYNRRLEGNVGPEVHVEVDLHLTARVGEPVTLAVIATDDGKPGPRPMSPRLVGRSHFVPNSATGLRVSWIHYRGPGEVVFDPPQTKVWEDRRDGGNSPWSAGWEPPPIPAGNRWVARATFSVPGTYVVRALASDGGLVDYEDITVVVTPEAASRWEGAGPRCSGPD